MPYTYMIFIARNNENRRIINDISIFVFHVGFKIAVIYIIQLKVKLITLKSIFLNKYVIILIGFDFVFNYNKTDCQICDSVNIYVYKKNIYIFYYFLKIYLEKTILYNKSLCKQVVQYHESHDRGSHSW